MNAVEQAYKVALGQRLRELRKSRGLSLMKVEEQSGGLWPAVVVGSYERGDRNPSVARLNALCEWYGASIAEVLPESRPSEAWLSARALLLLEYARVLASDEPAEPDDEPDGDAVPAQREYVGGVA